MNRYSVATTLLGLAFVSISLAQDNINSVQGAMRHSGGFAQLDALYTLAASSDGMEVQAFIFEADELDDAISRRSALIVLFSRLVELDPKSAIAIARSPRFANDRRYESEVWTEWGRIEMTAALDAAKQVRGSSDRNLVAQALFNANRQADLDLMQKIGEEMGVQPNRNSQTQFAVQLSNRSIEEALDYINTIPSSMDQQGIANVVGAYLGRRKPSAARKHADHLRLPDTRRSYLANVERGAGASDPRSAVDSALSNSVGPIRQQKTINAMTEYAKIDARGAAAYLANIENPTLRMAVENAIVSPMAMQDPAFAMQWAQKRDPTGRRGLYSVALAQTAVADPNAAFESAMDVENRTARQLAMQRVLSVIGQLEPQRAVDMLDLIRDEQDLQKAHAMVAQSWIQSDSDAAIDWLTADPRINEVAFCQQIAPILAKTDVDAARRLWGSLDGVAAEILQAQIVDQLATQRSVQETMTFIDEIDDADQKRTLRLRAIVPLAASSPDEAIEWMLAQPRDPETDSYIIMVVARTDSERAERLMQEIPLPAEQQQQLEQMFERMRDNTELRFD